MLGSCCVIYVFALLMNKVSLEVTVRQFVGESAVLPCSYAGDKNKVQTVTWVYNDKDNVCEFNPGGLSREVKYNVRAESFPEEYGKRNYSIKIGKLVTTDAGEYTCFLTPADHHENLHLFVDPKDETQRRPWIIPLIVVIVVLIILGCCAAILWWWCKKKKAQVI